MISHIYTRVQAKARARQIKAEGPATVSLAAALEKVAQEMGFRDWNTLSAKADDTPRSRWQIGQTVEGCYLGHAFTGRIKAARQAHGGFWHLTIVFDAPVDVVASEKFSNYRSQVNCVLNSQGVTVQHTSDGSPHLVLHDRWSAS